MVSRWLVPLAGLLAACAASNAAPRPGAAARTELTAAERRQLAARLASAPRRAPSEPIDVAVLPVRIDPALEGDVDALEVATAFSRELRREARLRVAVVPGDARASIEESAGEALAGGAPLPDVWLWLTVARAPGRAAIALEVESWARDGTGRRGVFQALGTLPGRAALLADAGDELRHAIAKVIGPTLPARGAEEALTLELLGRPGVAPAAGSPQAAPAGRVGLKLPLPEQAAKPDDWPRDSTRQE